MGQGPSAGVGVLRLCGSTASSDQWSSIPAVCLLALGKSCRRLHASWKQDGRIGFEHSQTQEFESGDAQARRLPRQAVRESYTMFRSRDVLLSMSADSREK